MARSGPGAGESPVAIAAPGSSGAAPRPGGPGRGNKVKVVVGWSRWAWRVMCCEAAASRRGVAVTAIALGALRGVGQENRASMMARPSARNKRQVQRLERQARAVRGAGQMARARPLNMAADGDAVAGEGRRA
jgi:hypothetical protein